MNKIYFRVMRSFGEVDALRAEKLGATLLASAETKACPYVAVFKAEANQGDRYTVGVHETSTRTEHLFHSRSLDECIGFAKAVARDPRYASDDGVREPKMGSAANECRAAEL